MQSILGLSLSRVGATEGRDLRQQECVLFDLEKATIGQWVNTSRFPNDISPFSGYFFPNLNFKKEGLSKGQRSNLNSVRTILLETGCLASLEVFTYFSEEARTVLGITISENITLLYLVEISETKTKQNTGDRYLDSGQNAAWHICNPHHRA